MPNSQQQQPHRVLVVDDDPSTLRLLHVLLKEYGAEPITINSPVRAQEWVQSNGLKSVACALIDYRMPQINGLQLLGWLLDYDPTLATVLMTAEGDVDLLTGALRQGVSDYVEKPFMRSALIAAIERATAETAERRYLATAAEEVRDLTVIHSRLVPRTDVLPAGFARGYRTWFETAFHPAHETGGDFVNCFPIDDNHLLIVTGDVSGHDLKAGFISSYFQGMCRGMIAMKATIEQVRAHFNDFLHSIWNRNRQLDDGSEDVLTSLSVCFLLIDFKRMTLSCLNNGFPLPLYCTGELEAASVGECGPPLGWFQDPETQCSTIRIAPTGSVFLSSDGLIDYAETNGDSPLALGDRLLGSSRQSAAAMLNQKRDDVLAVRFSWSKQDSATMPPRMIYLGLYPGNATGKVDAYQTEWRSALGICAPSLTCERLRDILLCCREAVLNAMIHGSAQRPDKRCRLVIALQDSTVSIHVEDEGSGHSFQPREAHEAGDLREHVSMGLRIIQCLATRFAMSRNGASLTMDFSTSPQTAK